MRLRWIDAFFKNFSRLVEPQKQRVREKASRIYGKDELVQTDWYLADAPERLGLDAIILLRFGKMIRHIVGWQLLIAAALVALHLSLNWNSTSHDNARGKEKLAWLAKLNPPPSMSRKWVWVYPALAFAMTAMVCINIFFSYKQVEKARLKHFDKVAIYDKEALDHLPALAAYQEEARKRGSKDTCPPDMDDPRKVIAARATKWALVTGFTDSDIDKGENRRLRTAVTGLFKGRRAKYEQQLLHSIVSMPNLGNLPDLIRVHNEDMARFEGIVDGALSKQERATSDDLNQSMTLRNEDRTSWWCCLRGVYRPKHVKAALLRSLPDEDDQHARVPNENTKEGQDVLNAIKSFEDVRMRKWRALELFLPTLMHLRIEIASKICRYIERQPLDLEQKAPSHIIMLWHTLMQLLTGSCCQGSSVFKCCKTRRHIAKHGDVSLHYAFIKFQDRVVANQAVRDLTEPKSLFECFCFTHRKTTIILAPAPEDIIWANLSMEPWQRRLAIVGNWCLMIGFTVIFIIPNAFTSLFLSQIPNFGIFFPSWAPAIHAHHQLVEAIEGVLPPIVQNVFYMYLPAVFRYFRKAAGELTRSGRERDVLSKLFIFFVFNNLIVFSCFTAFITLTYRLWTAAGSGSAEVFRETLHGIIFSLPEALGLGFRNTSTYWLTYMLQRNISAAVDLLPIDRIIWTVVSKVKFLALFFSPSALKSLQAPPRTDYPGTINNLTFTLVILFCFSPFQPLIAAPAAVFFLLNYVALKYKLVLVNYTAFESYGSYWHTAINQLLVATGFGICGFGLVVMSLTQEASKSPELWALVLSFLLLIAFRVYCGIRFETRYYRVTKDRPESQSVSSRVAWCLRRLIWWYKPREPPPMTLPARMEYEQWAEAIHRQAMPMMVPYLFKKMQGLEVRPKRQSILDNIIADMRSDASGDDKAMLKEVTGRMLASLRPDGSRARQKSLEALGEQDDMVRRDAAAEQDNDDFFDKLMKGIEEPTDAGAKQRLLNQLIAVQQENLVGLPYITRAYLNVDTKVSPDLANRLIIERQRFEEAKVRMAAGLNRANSAVRGMHHRIHRTNTGDSSQSQRRKEKTAAASTARYDTGYNDHADIGPPAPPYDLHHPSGGFDGDRIPIGYLPDDGSGRVDLQQPKRLRRQGSVDTLPRYPGPPAYVPPSRSPDTYPSSEPDSPHAGR